MTQKYDFAEKILYTQEELHERIQKIAKRISEDYKNKNLRPLDNPLILVCVLKGSFMFATDLSRALSDYNIPIRLEFICVSSYGGGVASSGQVRMLLDTRHSIEGKHVIIVEDIVDTAITMKYLYRVYKAREPASLKTVVLLDKREGRKVIFDVDYVVAEVPNFFVVGYGLDYDDSYRELRDVVILHPSVYAERERKKKEKANNNNNNNHGDAEREVDVKL